MCLYDNFYLPHYIHVPFTPYAFPRFGALFCFSNFADGGWMSSTCPILPKASDSSSILCDDRCESSDTTWIRNMVHKSQKTMQTRTASGEDSLETATRTPARTLPSMPSGTEIKQSVVQWWRCNYLFLCTRPICGSWRSLFNWVFLLSLRYECKCMARYWQCNRSVCISKSAGLTAIDWLYQRFTAHQHQKGRTVPKQVSPLDNDDDITESNRKRMLWFYSLTSWRKVQRLAKLNLILRG